MIQNKEKRLLLHQRKRPKGRRRNYKEKTTGLPKRTRTGDRRFCESTKFKKVESVQIYWDETEWGVAGNGTPQGGDEMILIFGGFDKILNLVGELM